MQKITFAFPDHESLWQFKNQTQAINVAITPKRNTISGLFPQQDVELATNKFNAITINDAISSSTAKESPGKTMQDWLKIYSINYSDRIKKLKRAMNLIHSLKLF
jgi:hypothetical protein